MDLLSKDIEKYEVSGFSSHELPVIWDKAVNSTITDIHGNKYIDFTSGIFVANVGHGAEKVKTAIKKQSNKLIHSYIFPNKPRVKLEKELCDITGMDKVLLLNTGSEANDAAIQMINRFKKGKILTLEGAYYGSTIGCRSLNNTINEETDPPSTARNIAAIFLQIFRGKDVKIVSYPWIKTWYDFAKSRNILFGIDEMQSGIGRTGKWFGYQHYDIKPDFITIGKALGGGLPISAVIGRKDLLELSSDLWSTHTGNPVCCASALATIKTIKEKKLLAKTSERDIWVGRLLMLSFPGYYVSGEGLMWAIDLKDANKVKDTIKKCSKKGLLLVSTHGESIKIAPPLTISDKSIVEGIRILRRCLV
jgi:4-aminobutyrate aminotransferase / (S)-3-amino-2-methylpropionate transaminase / 5-aminovalerate transaminase